MVNSTHGRLGVFVSVLLVSLSAGFPAAAQQATLLPEQEAALRGIARGETVDWPEMTEAQAAALYERAERYLELYQKYHLPHGLNADVWWNDYERSSVYRLEGLGDSAAWTGHYLAALVLKHSITQDAKTRADILAVLDKIDLLTIVSGRVGYIARYAGPADDEGYRGYYSVYGKGEDPERPGLGLRAFRGVEPYTDLVWLGYSSRDTYDGINFGLAITLGMSDKEVRDRVTRIVERVVDRLIEDGWDIPDGKGNVTRATPTFKLAWMCTAVSANHVKYRELDEELSSMNWSSLESIRLKSPFDSEYFANNLTFIRFHTLFRYPLYPLGVASGPRDAMVRLFEETTPHLNPHFAAICLSTAVDLGDENARAIVQGMLIDFPDPPKYLRVVDHRESGVEMHDENLTKYALLSRERVPNDFYWQRSPCLAHGGQDLPYEFPGIDMFLPYWMGRVIGVIPPPKS